MSSMTSVNPSDEVSSQHIVGCTIIAKNYLAMARVLCESFQRHHPGSPFFVLFLDDIKGYIDPAKEAFHCVEATDIGVPNFRGLVFKYNVLEASTAVKPYLLQHLFDRHQIENLVYFDPDILITSALEEVQHLLTEHNILLTPHVTSPYTDDARPGDLEILRAGSYNL